MSPLNIVTVVTNPVHYKSRVRLYKEFEAYIQKFPNVVLWTVEGVYPGSDFEVTQAGHPHHLQLRLQHEMWHKENLLNVLIKRKLSVEVPDWQHVAWVDADVAFARPDWAEATIAKLEVHPVVQMFSECMDLTDRCESIVKGFDSGLMTSCIKKWHQNGQKPTEGYTRYAGHYGYAWAITREAYERLGGLMEQNIIGSADYLMVHAFLGEIGEAIDPKYTKGYREYCEAFGQRAKHLRELGEPGFVEGLLMHHWHGPKHKRGYSERQRILDQHRFDPNRDLAYQANGALRWQIENPEHAMELHEELKRYFRSRDEDVGTANCDLR